MNEEKKYSVYKLTSPADKVYIGCTQQKPKDRWDYGCKYHNNKELSSDIKKFGWDNFEHIVLYSGLEEDEAYDLERELIHKYRSNDPRHGYNKSIGGKVNRGMIRSDDYRRRLSERVSGENHPFYGKHLSEETRRKISESNKGHPVSEETRRKIAEGNRGKHLSEETKKKIGDANRGRRASLETRRRMSESSSRKRKVLCVETGIIYNSIRDAAKDVGTPASNVGSVCTGKTKTAGGYSWKYVE